MTSIVILPGLDGTASLLHDFRANLRASGLSAQAIAYPVDRTMDYGELESFVRPQLPTDPFVLLGESFSGPLAIRIAAAAPRNLVGLVLSTTFARAPLPVLTPLAGLSRFAPARPPMPLLAWFLLGRWANPQLKAQLAAALVSVAPAVLRARAAAALRVNVSHLLPSVGVPVLQLVAEHDRLLTKWASAELSAALPSCRTVTIPGPHLLLQSAARTCAEEVAVFASGVAPHDASGPIPSRTDH